MDAMILSAGLGVRMRPLTLNTPKPLLQAGRKRLIEYHLENLAKAGFKHIIVNTSFEAEQFLKLIGNGDRYGVEIVYSHEGETPLNTGGGIRNALPLIQTDTFLSVNADVWTDFPFSKLVLPEHSLAHLVMVETPVYKDKGDFLLEGQALQIPKENQQKEAFTYSGIALMTKEFFSDAPDGSFPLYDLFKTAIESDRLTGSFYNGLWFDIGTPHRLEKLVEQLDLSN